MFKMFQDFPLALLMAMCLQKIAAQPQSLKADVIIAFLDSHNKARRAVLVPDLFWDDKLAMSAAAHGQKCVFEHSQGNYGENLYASSPKKYDIVAVARAAVGNWISEKPDPVDSNWACLRDLSCGHYTQVVWSTTQKLGCSIIHCDGHWQNIVVCQYFPPGNVIGQPPYNSYTTVNKMPGSFPRSLLPALTS